jgi:hypothetical protein
MSRATFEVRVIIKMLNGDAGTVDIASEGLPSLREAGAVLERAMRMARTMAQQPTAEAETPHDASSLRPFPRAV